MSESTLSRRDFLRLSSATALTTTLSACVGYPPMAESNPDQAPKPPQVSDASSAGGYGLPETPVNSPQEALQRLMEGNQRFVANRVINPNRTPQRRAALANSQKPFATILGCVDSRVPPEILFDLGLGDLLVIRSAGEVLDEAVTGSIEFGSFELQIPLIVVLGHERCGAVKAAIEALEHGGGHQGGKKKGEHSAVPGDLGYLVQNLRPAIEKARSWGMGDIAENAMRANVSMIVQRLKKSPVLSAAEESGRLKIVGARYDLDSGAVEMLFGV
ncbi:MAG: carbonic anhydrase [Candidatus Competibacteraceae bacterium]|nr:carbonic anhydrase [Candidatus Competibacteraceae bacterium]